MIFLAFNTEFRSSIHIGPYYNDSTLYVLNWVGPRYALIKILLLYTFLDYISNLPLAKVHSQKQPFLGSKPNRKIFKITPMPQEDDKNISQNKLSK